MLIRKLIILILLLFPTIGYTQATTFYCVYVEKVLSWGYNIPAIKAKAVQHLNWQFGQPRMITRVVSSGTTMYRGLVICTTYQKLVDFLDLAESRDVIKKIYIRDEVNGEPVYTKYNPLPDNFWTGISSGT